MSSKLIILILSRLYQYTPQSTPQSTRSLYEMSTAAMTDKDEQEVRREDQEKINEFGKLNNRLLEIRAVVKQNKEDIQKLEDAFSDIMSMTGGKICIMMGESFIESTEEEAQEHCERKQALLEERTAKLTEEESAILKKQAELKKALYARFGDSINLEN